MIGSKIQVGFLPRAMPKGSWTKGKKQHFSETTSISWIQTINSKPCAQTQKWSNQNPLKSLTPRWRFCQLIIQLHQNIYAIYPIASMYGILTLVVWVYVSTNRWKPWIGQSIRFLWVGTLNRLLLFRSNFSHILIQETKEPAMQQCEAQTEQQNTSENLEQVFWESLVEVFLKKSLTRVFGGQFWTYWKVFWGVFGRFLN